MGMLLLIFATAAGVSTYLTVHLLIRSEDIVVVPDLEGKEVVYALELLSDLQLNTKIKGSNFSHSIPRHHVISQDPQAGSEIKKGRDVRLIISKGARNIVLPNLIGLNVAQARIVLEENGLLQGNLSHVHAGQRPRQEILAQYPAPGLAGLRGDPVDLLVSSGPTPVQVGMIDFRGMDFSQAIVSIEKYNLETGTVRNTRNFGVANAIIMDHTPKSGYPVSMGSTIDFVINRTKTRQEPTAGQATLFRYRAATGLLRESVRVRLNRRTSAFTLFDAFIKPGQQIWLLVPRDEPAVLMLYVDDQLIQTENYQ
jgi:serine/threonine-protein kinase